MTAVVVLIRLHAKPEFSAGLRDHTLALLRAARDEPGCQSIQLLQNAGDPSQFTLLESWADKDYYLSDAHQQSAAMLGYLEATQSMIADVGVELLAPVDAQTGRESTKPEVEDDAA